MLKHNGQIQIKKIIIGIIGVLFLISCSSGEVSSPSPLGTDSSQSPSSVGELVFSDYKDDSFKVTWTKPTNSGMDKNDTNAQLAGYRVSWGTAAKKSEHLFETSNPDTLSHTITGLISGTQYYVKVQAKNDNTEGNIYNVGSSGSIYTTKPPGKVDESTITYRDHTTNGFKVDWGRVTDAGYGPQGALTSVGYLLEWSSDQGQNWQSIARSDYLAITETLSGLTSGTRYQVRITITNDLSRESLSKGRDTWTLSLPGQVGEVGGLVVSDPSYDGTATPHTGGFKVSWAVPTNTGLSATGGPAAVTGYEVAYAEVVNDVVGGYTSVPHTGTAIEYVFTGLETNTEYDIRVQTKTAAGVSAGTHVSGWTPSLPGAVDSTSIAFSLPTASTIRIAWGAPELGKAGGASSIGTPTSYKVEIAPEGGEYKLVRDDYSGNIITATGLNNSTSYRARITAKNKWGEASASTSTATGTTVETDATPPSAVGGLKVDSFTVTQVVFSWTAPTDIGTTDGTTSATLSGYLVKYKTADSDFIEIDEKSVGVRLTGMLTSTSTTATVVGLTGNTSYTFLVVAVNSGNMVGPDTEGSRIEQLTLPPPPQNLRKIINTCDKTTSLDLAWDASPGAGSYKIYRRSGAESTANFVANTTANTYVDTSLTAGTTYIYTVQACSADGCSGDSDPLSATTFKDKSFKSIFDSNKIPADFDGYDKMSRDIFSHYQGDASIKVKYLKPGGSGNGDGSSFDNAEGDLKAVLDGITDASATQIYAIFLAEGEYRFKDPIAMKNHVAIIGGVDECLDFSSTIPILDGENARRVFFNDGNNLNNTALLYRVTVKNGKASGSSFSGSGGGMFNNQSSPNLVKVTFSGNDADENGGGIYNFSSSPSLSEVSFSGNVAKKGGGMYNDNQSSPSLSEILFSGNSAEHGGGMYNWSSYPSLVKVAFSDNTAMNGSGGGMFNRYSSPILEGVTFSGNTAADGGGMFNRESSPSLVNVTFSGNTATDGGGMHTLESSPILVGVTFSENTATDSGGGMYNNNDGKDGPLIINGIFWKNVATVSGTEFYFNNDGTKQENLRLYNSIVERGIGANLVSGSSYPSIIQGGFASATGGSASVVISFSNIIAADPRLGALVNNGGSVLTHAIPNDSPAVNQGLYVKEKEDIFYYSENGTTWYTEPDLKTAVTLPTGAEDLTATDATGYTRISRPDLGAYEARQN